MNIPDHLSLLILIVSNAVGEQTNEMDLISEAGVRNEAGAVKTACLALGFRTEELVVSEPLAACESVVNSGADVVFNLCEGVNGDSGYEMHFAALLELSGIPFTGANPLTLGMARNKPLAKQLFRSRGIPVPAGVHLKTVPDRLPEGLSFPLICKPACEDASLGIFHDAVVRDEKSMREKVSFLLEKYPRDGILLEEYIDGREFNVAVLSDGRTVRVLEPSEIDFSRLPENCDRITGYEAKWLEDSALFKTTPSRCPADISPELKSRLQDTALSAYHALAANSYGRIDLRVDRNGRIFVLEYNPNPDISPDAGYAKALAASRLTYAGFVKTVITEALANFTTRRKS
ncbi:MAG: D-alanine--D-alanine ligase B [Lentisphaerae bacterium ADurb.Bin242]|nr:MAG: D-alanine--D-alanine ligase B [Lentisphaerae bacterium ADurb.Bin242]